MNVIVEWHSPVRNHSQPHFGFYSMIGFAYGEYTFDGEFADIEVQTYGARIGGGYYFAGTPSTGKSVSSGNTV